MKMKYLIIFSVLLIWACNEKKHFNLMIDNARGLKKGDKVLCKGIEIGDVEEIKLMKKGINVNFCISKEVDVPQDSRVSLISIDFVGTKAIDLELGNNPNTHNGIDTFICIDRSATKTDSILMNIDKGINKILDSVPQLLKKDRKNRNDL